MKSKKIYILIFSFLLISLSSCNDWFHKDIKEVSEISIFPIMELKEGGAIKRNVGDAWIDPGFNCSEVKFGDNDLNSKVIVDDSSVDMNTPGYYFVSYTVKNKYGYKKIFYRTIVVKGTSSLNTDITGNYKRGFKDEFMTVENYGNDTDFYYASNIHTGNDIIPSVLINYDDNKYCVPREWVEYSGGRYVDGYAEYVETGGFFPSKKLKFTLIFTDLDGNEFVLEGANAISWTKLN